MKKLFLIPLVILLVGTFIFGACTTPAPTPAPAAWQPPDAVYLTSTGMTSACYVTTVALLSGVTERTGVDFTIQPETKSGSRYALFYSRGVDYVTTVMSSPYVMYSGGETYPWGPQRITIVYNGDPLTYGIAVRGDSEIKTIDDIKGKRLVSFPGVPSTQLNMTAILAYANLTWDDVEALPVSSYPEACQALIEGRVDVTMGASTAGYMYDVAGCPQGLRWIELPFDNEEAWKRVKEAVPFLIPATTIRGAGLKDGETFEGYGKPVGFVAGYWVDEQLNYWMTKSIWESYDSYKDKHQNLKYWTHDEALNIDHLIIPYAAGSIRYFKEIGVWTPEHEAHQQELVANGEKFIQDYAQANPGWETNQAPKIWKDGGWQ